MPISEKLYTWQEFEAFAQVYPERLLELIDGRIVDKVTNEKHGKIASNISSQLARQYQNQHCCNHVQSDYASR